MKKQITLMMVTITLMMVLVSASVMAQSITQTISGNTISFTASGVSGTWGASLTEKISGGCTINGQTNLNFVMISDLPNPLTYTITSPSASTVCTFSGDYKFGTSSIVTMPTQSVTITGGSSDNTWMWVIGGIGLLIIVILLFKKR